MIPEPQQEQAVLYALGLLDADEAADFERPLASDPELQDFSRDCRETFASLILAAAPVPGNPPPELKNRIMAGLKPVTGVSGRASFVRQALPWALAAILMVSCGILAVRLSRPPDTVRSAPAVGTLTSVSFCQLEPAAASGAAANQPRAAIAWDPVGHQGVLQIVQLAPPGRDKDYQLWAVEEGHQDPVNAGLVRVDAQGSAKVIFQPSVAGGSARVLAFALSLEPAGGSSKNTGPILLQGKL